MVALIKALVPGSFLTWIVSLFVGSAGSSGGVLRVHYVMLGEHGLHWSWPLFTAGTFLAWAIIAMMES